MTAPPRVDWPGAGSVLSHAVGPDLAEHNGSHARGATPRWAMLPLQSLSDRHSAPLPLSGGLPPAGSPPGAHVDSGRGRGQLRGIPERIAQRWQDLAAVPPGIQCAASCCCVFSSAHTSARPKTAAQMNTTRAPATGSSRLIRGLVAGSMHARTVVAARLAVGKSVAIACLRNNR